MSDETTVLVFVQKITLKTTQMSYEEHILQTNCKAIDQKELQL